jgi:hypothetical protein
MEGCSLVGGRDTNSAYLPIKGDASDIADTPTGLVAQAFNI